MKNKKFYSYRNNQKLKSKSCYCLLSTYFPEEILPGLASNCPRPEVGVGKGMLTHVRAVPSTASKNTVENPTPKVNIETLFFDIFLMRFFLCV